MGNIVSLNPLRTHADVERAAVQLIEPLIPLLSPGKARLHLGETGAVYPADIAEMEAFARPLWAIVPMLAGGCEAVEPIWAHWKQGLKEVNIEQFIKSIDYANYIQAQRKEDERE